MRTLISFFALLALTASAVADDIPPYYKYQEAPAVMQFFEGSGNNVITIPAEGRKPPPLWGIYIWLGGSIYQLHSTHPSQEDCEKVRIEQVGGISQCGAYSGH